MLKKPQILMPMIIVVTMVSVTILWVANVRFDTFLRERTELNIERSAAKLVNTLEKEMSFARTTTISLSQSNRTIAAMQAGDGEDLRERMNQLMEYIGFDVYIFTDAQGVVLVSHEDRFPPGQNISHNSSIQAALSGKTVSSLERGPTHNLQVVAGTGVYSEDYQELLGVLFVGSHIGQQDFFDELKHITGSEFTLFVDDECVMSSIESPCGTIGKGLSLPDMEKNTIQSVSINGEDFLGTLLPFESLDGSILGFMMVGQFIHDIQSVATSFTNFGISFTIIVLSIGLLVIIIRAKAINESIGRRDQLLQETNLKLEKALEEALSASRAKSEFLSIMSHEMRTPLNIITGLTHIAIREKGEPANKALEKVGIASQHLLTMINNVLEIAKIEADKLEIVTAPFDLPKTLQKTAMLFTHVMEEKNHRFILEFDEQLPHTCLGDKQRIMQVLINLISNAATYTPNGGTITFRAACLQKEEGQSEILFSILDTGIGIPPQQHQKLFRRFEQLDKGSNRKYGGAGLG